MSCLDGRNVHNIAISVDAGAALPLFYYHLVEDRFPLASGTGGGILLHQ